MKEYKVKVTEKSTKWFNLEGKLHREDGPAVERANGDKEHYINGVRHRENGPAIEWANGRKEYYINGELHREDGPAIEYADGSKHYYINDIQITKEEFENRNKSCIEKIIEIEGVKYKLSKV